MKYSVVSNKKDTQTRQVSVAELIDLMKSPQLQNDCRNIANAMSYGDEKYAEELKGNLPAVVVNELYKQFAPRKKGTGEPTGLVLIDYDYCQGTEAPRLMNELKSKLMKAAISHPLLKDLIVAAHVSPRLHGVHVWFRWIDGCTTIEECQAKFAELAELPDYDKGCHDSSRISFLVPMDYFFIQNWDAMEQNEAYAELQKRNMNKKNGKEKKNNGLHRKNNEHPTGSAGTNLVLDLEQDRPREGGLETTPEDKMYGDLRLKDIFQELVRLCAPAGLIDEEGNVKEGARDNTLLRVCNLFRYVVDNKPERILAYMPKWAQDLDEEKPGTCRDKAERMCERNMSPMMPPTLRTALANLRGEEQVKRMTKEERDKMYGEELEKIENSQRKFYEVPQTLPPVIDEFVKAAPFAWKPAVALSLLPVLGTLMSRVRSVYLDGRTNSLSFQTVIEADYASGKSLITDMARFCLTPLTDADLIGNEKLNAYNALVERTNKTEKLPEVPDVCVRKITGQFTVAGFNKTLGTSKGLHMWCATSEIDEVKDVWKEVSYILRKAYDNDWYGRSLQSNKQFNGERQVFFNTLLTGTPERINKVYNNPEDGLVSRTIFFRLLHDSGKDIPMIRLNAKTQTRLQNFLQKLHDKYSLSPEGEPVPPRNFALGYINKAIKKWLDEKYDESVRTDNYAEDAYRRRDAVNGFRAGVLAHVLTEERAGRVLTESQKKVVKEFALWVAEYCLQSHIAKFGTELKRGDTTAYGLRTTKTDVLDQLPDSFTLADAYERIKSTNRSGARVALQRLVEAGYLKREDRGFYVKTKLGKK